MRCRHESRRGALHRSPPPSPLREPAKKRRLASLLFAALAACSGAKSAAPAASPATAAATGSRAVALPATVPATASTRATLKLDSTWGRCHEGFVVAQGDVAGEAARLAAGCAASTRMHRVAGFAGEQSAAARPQTFRWKAQAGHCYRAYAVGAPAIKNLDLLMIDSTGAALGQNGVDEGAPVLLGAGAVCFKQDDDAALVVSVGDGTGAFAVEVWSD